MQDNMFYTKDHEWIDFQGLISLEFQNNWKKAVGSFQLLPLIPSGKNS